MATITTTNSTTGDSVSVFKGRRLKPRIRKVWNLYDKTYVNIQERSKEVWCRLTTALEERGQLYVRFNGLRFACSDY